MEIDELYDFSICSLFCKLNKLDNFVLSLNTKVDRINFFRDIRAMYYKDKKNLMGDPGCIIKINKTVLIKRNYNSDVFRP